MSDLTIAGNYQSNPNAVYIPYDTNGLVYCGMYGLNAARCSRNFAPGYADAVVIGNPTYGADYVQLLPGTNWLQTMAEQTDDLTLIAIAQPTLDAASLLISNTTGPTVTPPPVTTRGAGLYYETGTVADGKVTLSFNQSIRDGSNVDQVASVSRALATTVGAYSFQAGRCVASTGVRTVKDWTSNLSATATSAFAIDRGTNRFCVGGAQTVGGIFTNAVNYRTVLIYNSAKTDAEIAAIYADAKAYALVDGVII